MAVPLVNTLEGGTDGTAITAGNSGGASGNAFDSVSATTHTFAYAASPVLSQTLCAKLTPDAGLDSSFVDWSTALGTVGPTVFTRVYFDFPSAVPNSTINQRIVRLVGAGATRASVLVWGSANTGHMSWADSTDSSSGTNLNTTLVAGTVYRLENKWVLSATVGQIEFKLYLGSSTTVLETLTSAASFNFGATTCDTFRVGYINGCTSTTMPVIALDGYGVDTAGYMGPIVESGSPYRNPVPFQGRGRNL